MPLAMMFIKVEDALRLVPDLVDDYPELYNQLRLPDSGVSVLGQVSGLEGAEKDWLESIPRTVLEGIRSMIVAAAEQRRHVHLAFWLTPPGSDFELKVQDTTTETNPNGYVNLLLSGPEKP